MDQELKQIKEVYEDGEAVVNGRPYKLHPMTHLERRKVFVFFNGVQAEVADGGFDWLDSEKFERVEPVIWKHVSQAGTIIGQHPGYWDEHPADYLPLLMVCLGAMSYPFFGDSAGAPAPAQDGGQRARKFSPQT